MPKPRTLVGTSSDLQTGMKMSNERETPYKPPESFVVENVILQAPQHLSKIQYVEFCSKRQGYCDLNYLPLESHSNPTFSDQYSQ